MKISERHSSHDDPAIESDLSRGGDLPVGDLVAAATRGEPGTAGARRRRRTCSTPRPCVPRWRGCPRAGNADWISRCGWRNDRARPGVFTGSPRVTAGTPVAGYGSSWIACRRGRRQLSGNEPVIQRADGTRSGRVVARPV